VHYEFLRTTVDRQRESANYRLYRIGKRSGGYRWIHSVNGKLLKVQSYINREILQRVPPHAASMAYHPSGGIRRCAEQHCGCRWLLNFDLKDFFWSINEWAVYKAFRSLGYKKLLSFELSRLCTTTRLPRWCGAHVNNSSGAFGDIGRFVRTPYACIRNELMGVLPQGGPTSPMLGNLCANALDLALTDVAAKNGFVYTRYADDLSFSRRSDPGERGIKQVRQDVLTAIRQCGFRANAGKSRIYRPGSRRQVLGLLVDGERPRLMKQMRARIEKMLHAADRFNLDSAAKHYGFDSSIGFYNHLSGLVAYAKDVDSERGRKYAETFKKIPNPWKALADGVDDYFSDLAVNDCH